ncbi:FHA domain-containing protein [Pantanalinema rosaneae CENA516]|uniref:FHA domain-containing protein n=1 Tax=Pantanalinema rosaneae TaxID=1620701 RepID=UPI003D6FC375
MIVCPNCNHQNPDGAVQCEACYTPLPAMTACPNCGAAVQTDASFCGQCGFNLKSVAAELEQPLVASNVSALPDLAVPDLELPPDALIPPPVAVPDPVPAAASLAALVPPTAQPEAAGEVTPPIPLESSHTQIQAQVARLLHVQTNTVLEVPTSLTVIHIGKPNDRIPPDIDVSGFPNSEIVSRIHADIRVEGDAYFIEDVGSSNGTYINNLPLSMGNRHRLRSGDRIALGKGDKVTFLFQMS